MASMRIREMVAERKLDAPEGFQWFRWEVIGPDAVMLTGCVSSGVVSRGPRKGRPKYDGERRSAVVTDAEARAEAERYEAETGKCCWCMGDGRELKRASAEGIEWRGCRHCEGTGRAVAKTTA